MAATKTVLKKSNAHSNERIPAWELSVIDVFVRGAAMFGFRKSVAMVYGALYCSREPLAALELQEKLQLSRGAVVEALQLLRRLGAARVHLKIGERRDFFSAETNLKKFIRGFLKEILEPALEKADIRLSQAKETAEKPEVAGLNTPEDLTFARARIHELCLWKTRFSEILPLLENLFDSDEK